MTKEKLPDDETVCVLAMDTAGFVKTSTSCARKDAQHYAKYYRSIGYHSRAVTYEELEKIGEEESRRRLANI